MDTLNFFQSNGNIVVLNLLIQITIFSALVIVVASVFKHNAVARYNILFPSLIALIVLTTASLIMQMNEKNLVAIEMDGLLATSGVALSEPVAEFTASDFEFAFEPFAIGEEQSIATDVSATRLDSASSTWATWEFVKSWPLYLVFFAFWVLGFFCLVYRLLRSFHAVDRISQKSKPLQPQELELVKSLITSDPSHSLTLNFRTSGDINSPMLAGISNPTVLLPDGFLQKLSAEQVRSVLVHEFAHFSRGDLVANFVQKVFVAIFWFHPLVHSLDRMLDRAREEICDNHVLNQNSPINYSEILLKLGKLYGANSKVSIPSHTAVGILGSSWNLEQRISDLLNANRNAAIQLSTLTTRGIQIAVVTASILLSACQVSSANPQDTNDQVSDFQVQAQNLDEQSQRLLQERQRLEEQARRLEDQLQRLRYALETRTQTDGQSAISKRDIMRSLSELRTLLITEGDENNFGDIQQLTGAILLDIAQASRVVTQNVLNDDAHRTIEEILRSIDTNSYSREELVVDISRLSTQVDPDLTVATTGQNADDQRPPPLLHNPGGQLSQSVMEAIIEVQELMSPEDRTIEPDLGAAKELLDALYADRFESMNDFEKSTVLNFYTNYHLANQDYPQALETFEQILTIESLNDSTRLRTLRSLG